MSEPPAPPPAPMPAGNHHPDYEFIMNPQKPKKRGLFSGGNSPKQRILMISVFVGGILVVLFLFITVVFGGKGNSEQLIDLAQQQAEIVRIADIGTTKAKGPDAKNLAVNTKFALLSSENQTKEYLQKTGHKVSDKQLAVKKNASVDQQLTTAEQNNRFDETFTQIIDSSLESYQKSVKQLYDSTSNKSEKEILAVSYNGVNVLLGKNTQAN